MEHVWNICGDLWMLSGGTCLLHFTPILVDGSVSEVAPPDRQICGLKLSFQIHGSHTDSNIPQLRFGLQRESLVGGWDLRF